MYRPNNIEFRVASAAAIGEFKTAQAHTFLQVCRKEFEFGLSAREIVLLSYDRFSQWLLNIEQMFLDEPLTIDLISQVALVFRNELKTIEEIVDSNPQIFEYDVVTFVKTIHEYAAEDMPLIFSSMVNGKSSSKTFISITECLTDYLQHLLLAMHEFNNNFVKKKNPFLCIGRYSLLSKQSEFKSIKRRAEFFRSHIRSDMTFQIKNYTDEDLSDKVISVLDELGIRCHAEEMAA